jgi:hypothetical protein
MKTPKNTSAEDPDVASALAAMQRAADSARKTAIQTDTGIVIQKDGKLTRISAEELRKTQTAKTSA